MMVQNGGMSPTSRDGERTEQSRSGTEAAPAGRDAFTARHWNSRVTVQIVTPRRGSLPPVPTVESVCAMILGRMLEDRDWAGLTGAPDDAQLAITAGSVDHGDEIAIEIRHPWIEEFALRRVYRDGSRTVLRNEFLSLVAEQRGGGIGTRMLALQAAAASALGVARIEAEADGHPGSRTRNGYYTWARLGFNGSLRPEVRARLPAAFARAADLNDLMARPGGAAWWRANGHAFTGVFDLTTNSRSWQLLTAYTASEGIVV
jgi:hypothetical protein